MGDLIKHRPREIMDAIEHYKEQSAQSLPRYRRSNIAILRDLNTLLDMANNSKSVKRVAKEHSRPVGYYRQRLVEASGRVDMIMKLKQKVGRG